MDEIGLTMMVSCDDSHSCAKTSHCVGPVWKTVSRVSPSRNWQCLRTPGRGRLDVGALVHFVLHRESFDLVWYRLPDPFDLRFGTGGFYLP